MINLKPSLKCHRVKSEDNSFKRDGAHSDISTIKINIKFQKTTLEIHEKYTCERGETALAMKVKKLKDTKNKEEKSRK